ncbi:hypothetical protein Ae201684P_014172 [Aphanomyces euteiches]|uniref:Aspartyl/asparaginy/proline hydroxylase domain-containing protein n=1 Tax=Aphanomyces euteiches TaxID=100861 RepID=A0A6G0WYQ0_9STRA|nr:hypothetical protein Ae201684_010389 [Aphanomyces euteiches]KAH9090369.1 hypothetical protein Ae201684P_014172 [Aphanomyces euteiches]KAH9153366.1 hypothetical protein AeRB84_004373 [Aphanomyces euteiches]
MGSKAKAALLRSALCLTTAKPRPSPTLFMFPGLKSAPFHNPRDFEWTAALEANLDTIREEYLRLKDQKKKSDYVLTGQEHTLHQGQWDWFSYVSKGKRMPSFEEECPNTTALLNAIPGFMTSLPFAYAFFSTLQPQSSIKAHSAPCNIRLRCHFPLWVPKGCGIRVADETTEWEEGKCLLFDDSYDHEVWHDGLEGERVVLLFDIWHPDLIPEEREALVQMFADAKEKGWLSDK